jgi:hypothetical protein
MFELALMMETVSTSETSVNFYRTTRHNIPEDSHLQNIFRRHSPAILVEFYNSVPAKNFPFILYATRRTQQRGILEIK